MGGPPPFGGRELGPHLTQCGRAEAYLHSKFHLDPSKRLATLHERHRQTGQRIDSIGRTVLQTVAQKRFALRYRSVVCLSRLSVLSVTLVYCGQTVKRIKMKLGMQVGLGHCHTVLDGDPGPALLWPNGWMDEDATWYGSVDLRANHIVLDGFPALCERGTAPPPPPFRPMSVVATVAHLSYC